MILFDETPFDEQPTATFSPFDDDDATTEAETVDDDSHWDFAPSPAFAMVRGATAIWDLRAIACEDCHKRPH